MSLSETSHSETEQDSAQKAAQKCFLPLVTLSHFEEIDPDRNIYSPPSEAKITTKYPSTFLQFQITCCFFNVSPFLLWMDCEICICTGCLSWFCLRRRKKTAFVWSYDLRGFTLGVFHFLSQAGGIRLLVLHPSSKKCAFAEPKCMRFAVDTKRQRYGRTRFTEDKAEFLFMNETKRPFCPVAARKCHMEGKESGEMESQWRKVNKHGCDAGLENLGIHGRLFWHFAGFDRVRQDTCSGVSLAIASSVTHGDIWRIVIGNPAIRPCRHHLAFLILTKTVKTFLFSLTEMGFH